MGEPLSNCGPKMGLKIYDDSLTLMTVKMEAGTQTTAWCTNAHTAAGPTTLCVPSDKRYMRSYKTDFVRHTSPSQI